MTDRPYCTLHDQPLGWCRPPHPGQDVPHYYMSTACLHERKDGQPDLHDACRRTCKFCGRPCQCPRHASQDAPAVTSWTDQARNMARELLALIDEQDYMPAPLGERIATDPALFWLRGEEVPPGHGYREAGDGPG